MAPVTVVGTLPVFNATALSGCQFLGYVCAVQVGLDNLGNIVPAVGGGVGTTKLNDSSGGPFGENQNLGVQLTVSATATGTNATPVFGNQSKRGFNLFLNIISIAATCTIRMTYQEIDPTANNAVNIFTASIDAQATAAAPETFLMQVYPGIVAPGTGVGANLFVVPVAGGQNGKVIVSITATASGGGANINYNVAAVQLP